MPTYYFDIYDNDELARLKQLDKASGGKTLWRLLSAGEAPQPMA